MTATGAIQPVNATIPQIEDALRAGRPVQEIADELSEPRATVYAVQRAMAAGPVDPRSLSSVAELAAAAERSGLQRTRTLGVRLSTLVADLRGRLAEEYDHERVAAEVAMLERRLNEARSKLRRPAPTRRVGRSSDQLAAARKAAQGTFLCKCGRTSTTKAGLRAHERHCATAVAS